MTKYRVLAWWLECLLMAWEIWVQSQVESYQRLKKMVLGASLLNTQHYKVWIKDKVEQSKEELLGQLQLQSPTLFWWQWLNAAWCNMSVNLIWEWKIFMNMTDIYTQGFVSANDKKGWAPRKLQWDPRRINEPVSVSWITIFYN